MFKIEGDRRTQVRYAIERPCKIFEPRSGKYYSGMTCDLSGGGLLLDIPRVVDLKPGDLLHVGVAMTRRQDLLKAKEMMEARVVRAMTTVDDRTRLAVSFQTEVQTQPDCGFTGLQAAA